MKNKMLLGFFALILLFAGLSAFRTINADEFAGTRSTYRPTVVSGAILNAENDTVVLPVFLTNYQLQLQCIRTAVTGTHNVKMYLQESTFPSGTTNWRTIDSTTTTTATLGFVRQDRLFAYRYRVIFDGTGPTQSSTWSLATIAKPLE